MNNKNAIYLPKPPVVELATNKFINVPIILKYEDTNLIEVVRVDEKTKVNYEAQIPIYHSDGTYLAKVVGTRMFLTEDGKKAGLKLEHPDKMTICKLNKTTLFEIARKEASSLSITAELFTPKGYMIKSTNVGDKFISLIDNANNNININGIIMKNCTFSNLRIGIHLMGNGKIAIGVN